MPDSKPSERDPEPFEDVLAALEAEVKRLEQGELSLDETLEAFERGLTLASNGRRRLEAAEARVEELIAIRDGQLQTKSIE